jgi:micrococcal nuclease
MAFDAWCIPWHTEAVSAQALQILDAVTIEVEIDEKSYLVRYIGLSLPEETGASNIQALAAEKNRALVEGKNILLIKDISESDEEGRLLRYVIADGIFVNQALAKSGYAQVTIIPPDTSCQFFLREASASALANQLGMWAPAPTPTRPVVLHPTATVAQIGEILITTVRSEGTGWQDPDEFVEFRNLSAHPIQMEGWRLSDLEGHTFIFPDFIIYAGNYCRIYTNAYRPGRCGLSFYSLSPIWDDLEDCAYLYDSGGNLVEEYCYGW